MGMTLVLLLLTWCVVPCVLSLAGFCLLVRLHGRLHPSHLARRARAVVGRLIRRFPVLRRVLVFGYRFVPGSFRRLKTRYLVEIGRLLVNRDLWEPAVGQFTRAIEKSPAARGVYLMRGRALHRLGRLEDALEDYRRALRIEGGDPEETKLLYHYLSTLLVALGDIDQALLYAYLCLEMHRGNPAPAVEFRPGFVPQGAYHVQ